MKTSSRMLGSCALGALTGGLLLAASALAQDQTQPAAQPMPGAQPSTSQPAPGAQTGAPADQTMSQPGMSGQQGQMGSPQSTSSGNGSTISASAGQPLSKVKDAKTTLASASVQDSTGQQIGQVTTVHTTKKGTPTTVDVTLQSAGSGQAKTVAIKASKLHYDQSSNTLKADLTSSEVQQLPTATSM